MNSKSDSVITIKDLTVNDNDNDNDNDKATPTKNFSYIYFLKNKLQSTNNLLSI